MRGVVAAIVIVGVGRRLWLEREQLASYEARPAVGWLIASGATYLGGLSTCAIFWWKAMRDRGARPGWLRTFAAYFAGHLGKYVPGKGLVVVIRAGMMREAGVSIAAGAITCVHETVLMMATGAAVALAILTTTDVPHREWLIASAAVSAAGLGYLALPPVVSWMGQRAARRVADLASTSLWGRRLACQPVDARSAGGTPASHANDSHAARWSTVLVGAGIIAVGWLLMGLSLAAVLASMRELAGLVERCGAAASIALLTAVVALATVGGFVSLLPGGLGSREWILVETLGPVLGPNGAAAAAIAAVLLRIVWIVAEAAGTGLCCMLDRQCKKRLPNSD